MHDGRSLCCVKLLRLIKKSVFYSRYFVVSILSEMRIHTEAPAGGDREASFVSQSNLINGFNKATF